MHVLNGMLALSRDGRRRNERMAILRQVGFQDMGFRLSYDARSLARNPGVETLL